MIKIDRLKKALISNDRDIHRRSPKKKWEARKKAMPSEFSEWHTLFRGLLPIMFSSGKKRRVNSRSQTVLFGEIFKPRLKNIQRSGFFLLKNAKISE